VREVGAGGLAEALGRHGFVLSQSPAGDGYFESAPVGAIGSLAGLPVRVEEGRRPGESTVLIRVRFGLADTTGDPKTVAQALLEAPNARVSHGGAGVTVLAEQQHSGADADAACAYVEDLARRAVAAIDPAPAALAKGARPFTVHGYAQWVKTADVEGIEDVALRHFELNDGRAEWDDWAVSLAPTADGAMAATGIWPEEAPFISLMGRLALLRVKEDGGEEAALLGSGVCTLTNRRLVAAVYARPDDDVLEGIGKNMAESGITFSGPNGRPVNPFSVMSEERKALQFIEGAGAVDEAGCGTVLALSAFPRCFTGVTLEGGLMHRALGIPRLSLHGGPLEMRIVPFRVLDQNLHTLKPRRGQIQTAVDEWWAMTAQAAEQEGV
jgi:hypothetical protein